MALEIYKIPGVMVCGFLGPFGVGKTLGMLEHAVELSENLDLDIVANFRIDAKVYRDYCRYKKYKIALLNRVYQVDSFEELFQYKQAIYLLDEAGLEFFSRNFKNKGKDSFMNLFQVRKYRSFLLYSAQSFNQLDLQLRKMTQLFIVCKGFQKFSKEHRSFRLFSRSQRAFETEAYELFVSDPDLQLKMFKPMQLSKFRSFSSSLVGGRFGALCSLVVKLIFYIPTAFKRALDRGYLGYFFVYLEQEYFRFKRICLSTEDYLFKMYDSFGIVGQSFDDYEYEYEPLLKDASKEDLSKCFHY